MASYLLKKEGTLSKNFTNGLRSSDKELSKGADFEANPVLTRKALRSLTRSISVIVG